MEDGFLLASSRNLKERFQKCKKSIMWLRPTVLKKMYVLIRGTALQPIKGVAIKQLYFVFTMFFLYNVFSDDDNNLSFFR